MNYIISSLIVSFAPSLCSLWLKKRNLSQLTQQSFALYKVTVTKYKRVENLPDNLKSSLPTIEEIEQELKRF